jgi:hypothetical protein
MLLMAGAGARCSSVYRPGARLPVVPSETARPSCSQIARGTFGGRGIPYFLVQLATMLILVLAAKHRVLRFPASRVDRGARRYLPRQFATRATGCVFSNWHLRR